MECVCDSTLKCDDMCREENMHAAEIEGYFRTNERMRMLDRDARGDATAHSAGNTVANNRREMCVPISVPICCNNSRCYSLEIIAHFRINPHKKNPKCIICRNTANNRIIREML